MPQGFLPEFHGFLLELGVIGPAYGGAGQIGDLEAGTEFAFPRSIGLRGGQQKTAPLVRRMD